MDSYQRQDVSFENNPTNVISRRVNARTFQCVTFVGVVRIFFGGNQQVESMSVELYDNNEYATEFKPVQDYNLIIRPAFSIHKYLLTFSIYYKKLIRISSYIFRFIYNF